MKLKFVIQTSCCVNFVFHLIFDPLGVDFGTLVGSKTDPNMGAKSNVAKTQKLAFRLHGNAIFEVPGGSKIDQKSMPKPLQDKTST